MKRGIDISEWQGELSDLSWNKIKNDGIEFVIIRCGYTGYGKSKVKRVDKFFENNYNNAKKHGIPVGVYYFSCATSIEEAREEANFVLDIIKGKKFEYPIVIDTEDDHDINNTSNSNKSQASIGKRTLTPIIKTFCDILEEKNYYVSIYASTYWFENNLNLNDLQDYDKWIAQWSNSVSVDYVYGIWQYSSTGRVDGIVGNVDMNYSYLDYPSIMSINGLNGYVKDDVVDEPLEDVIDREEPLIPVLPSVPDEEDELDENNDDIENGIINRLRNFFKKIFSFFSNIF